jgi:hypothetical protein
MRKYWIKGLFLEPAGVKKMKKNGHVPQENLNSIEIACWADSPEEALQEVEQQFTGGKWIEGPEVVDTSEEQRMRAMGAPELPGIEAPKPRRKK